MGVCAHSSASSNNSYVIFSVVPEADDGLFKWLRDEGIGYKALNGSWRGHIERSYIINQDHLPALKIMGWLDGQESILLLGPQPARRGYRLGVIEWLDNGQQEPAMRFVQTTKEYAMRQEGWTHDPSDNSYWILVEDKE